MLVHWLPPCAGKIKLNTDGCWYLSNRKVGFGGIFRDDKGEWIAMISDAQAILSRTQSTLTPIYREANQCANHLARIRAEHEVVSVDKPLSLREFWI
ncbi:hypothetical protein RHMOL_Rhmol10G0147600 [Rhododendron molle]|uniref:Uncharacterized protein n=1 Tax=Rhododendron molle TaxID=49168 RepID=A0ACC0M206_RHOML|nr:hypothetical protein RHMOL_Rhmol10G0147600 [Rhododendron molle]